MNISNEAWCEERDGAWFVRVKAVPGAKQNAIAGVFGDRLKIRVAAPPEGGKANEAIRTVLAEHLGCKPRAVELVSGASSSEKVFRCASSRPA